MLPSFVIFHRRHRHDHVKHDSIILLIMSMNLLIPKSRNPFYSFELCHQINIISLNSYILVNVPIHQFDINCCVPHCAASLLPTLSTYSSDPSSPGRVPYGTEGGNITLECAVHAKDNSDVTFTIYSESKRIACIEIGMFLFYLTHCFFYYF